MFRDSGELREMLARVRRIIEKLVSRA